MIPVICLKQLDKLGCHLLRERQLGRRDYWVSLQKSLSPELVCVLEVGCVQVWNTELEVSI